jgi:hypothetical protein
LAERPVTAGTVLVVALSAIAGVILFAWATDLVPQVRSWVTSGPLVIIGLVAVTAIVLVLALRPRRS